MQAITKKLVRNSGFMLLMAVLCAVGVKIALTRTAANEQAALTTVSHGAARDVVFVLDAGHGEST